MSETDPSEGRLSRPVVFAIAGIVVIVVAIGMSVWSSRREEAPPSPQQQAASSAPKPAASEASGGQKSEASTPPATAPAATPETPGANAAPSFDVVRIARDGRAVMAGRAAPGATVIIMDGDQEIGRVKADDRGEWVFTPDRPLAPGSTELALRSELPSGAVKEGDAPVVLIVPQPEKAGAQGASEEALAIKVKPGGAVQVLQVPSATAGSGPVSIEVVNFDEQGHLSIAGSAPPQANMQIYIDNEPIGSTTADAKGAWSLSVDHKLAEGSHTARADQVGPGDKVLARAEITFASGGQLPAAGKVTVAYGNSLWRIARRAYGSGFDYVVIYRANKDQIRNPDLIYPGQIFKLPAKG